jgi:hypothetical protein
MPLLLQFCRREKPLTRPRNTSCPALLIFNVVAALGLPNFRQQLGQELIDRIDSTERWWPAIKRIRDDLAHREHTKIVFGGAKDGVLFQLYGTALHKPVVVHPKLLWPRGHHVADFRLYSAAVVAELLVFLDEMGKALASALGLDSARLTPTIRGGDFSFLMESMKQLAA